MRFSRVPKFGNERMLIQKPLNDTALDAESTSVNQTNFAETSSIGRAEVLVDDRWDIARVERVEVETILHWEADGLVVCPGVRFPYHAPESS